MEFVFGFIALVITLLTVYGIGRTLYSHRELIRVYGESEFLGMLHMLIGITLWSVIFVTLCAFNNTFWGLPYLTT